MPGRQWKTFEEILQQWHSDALEFLRRDAPKIVIIIVVSFVLIRLVSLFTNRLKKISHAHAFPSGMRSQQLRTLAGVINGVGIFVIIFLALMQILPVLGINMGPLLASAGIVGLAIGFGAQTLVKDVINGFFILLENHYDVGDTIRISGVQGNVEDMTLRRTVLRDGDGTVHIVPNSEIKVVSNMTRDWNQVALQVSVSYSEPSDRVIGLLKEVASEVRNDPRFSDQIVAEPEVPGIDKVAGDEVDYLLLVKTRPGSQVPVARELRRKIKECFEKSNVKPGGPSKMYVVNVSGVPGGQQTP